MADLKERILKVFAQPQLAALATVTLDGKPWVRYVVAMADANMTIRMAVFVGSRKVEQIKNNPEVHLTCGVRNPADMKPYLQIQGRARFTVDVKERHGFWNDTLKHIFYGADDPKYGIIVVEPYRVEYCMPGIIEHEVWSAS